MYTAFLIKFGNPQGKSQNFSVYESEVWHGAGDGLHYPAEWEATIALLHVLFSLTSALHYHVLSCACP